MSDFFERLEIERNELHQRIQNLEDFLFTDEYQKLDGHQQALLEIQENAMVTYLSCLNNRITLIERF